MQAIGHIDGEDEGSVTSKCSENSLSRASSANDGHYSDNESGDWILDEINRQIDDQLQADIDRQLEEQLWKEMDAQIEKQLDEQIQKDLNQQLNDMISTRKDYLNVVTSKIKGIGDFSLETAGTRTPIEPLTVQQEATVSSINDQIRKIAVQYEGLDLESMK